MVLIPSLGALLSAHLLAVIDETKNALHTGSVSRDTNSTYSMIVITIMIQRN